jgi:hypothetical protein
MSLIENGLLFGADKGGAGSGGKKDKKKPDIGAQQTAMGAAAHDQAASYQGDERPTTPNLPGGFADQGTQQAAMGAAASGEGAQDNKN